MATTVHGLADLIGLKGVDLGHSDWLAIGQNRIDTFADATDDHQWIHVDAAKPACVAQAVYRVYA